MLSHQFVVKTAEVNEEILRFLNFFLNFRQYLEYKVSQITPLQLKGYLTLSFHGLWRFLLIFQYSPILKLQRIVLCRTLFNGINLTVFGMVSLPNTQITQLEKLTLSSTS